MTDVPIYREIDLRGHICPSTLLVALREITSSKEELKSGTHCLVFLSDNRSSTTHIVDAVGVMGYRIDVEKEQQYYRITICRKH